MRFNLRRTVTLPTPCNEIRSFSRLRRSLIALERARVPRTAEATRARRFRWIRSKKAGREEESARRVMGREGALANLRTRPPVRPRAERNPQWLASNARSHPRAAHGRAARVNRGGDLSSRVVRLRPGDWQSLNGSHEARASSP